MLLEASQLFRERGTDIVSPVKTITSPKYNIPITYHLSIMDDSAGQERIIGSSRTTLSALRATDILPQLFEGDENTGLETTIAEMTQGRFSASEVASIDGRLLQFGLKALILLHKINFGNDEKAFFVSYLSRNPLGSRLDLETQNDFANLSKLSEKWEKNISYNAKEKYSVVKPFAINRASINNQQYRYFTMSYLPLREIAFEYALASDKNGKLVGIIPFASYNIQLDDKDAEEMVNIQERAAVNKNISVWEAKRHDILIAEALAYHITDGRWPAKEHLIGAGDLNGIMTENHGFEKMGWTTVRGGFSSSPSFGMFRNTFVDRILKHEEYNLSNDPECLVFVGETFRPFDSKGMSKNALLDILDEAHSMLD